MSARVELENFAAAVLLGQENSLIARPMLSQCKLAVIIPAFNESENTILLPLLSLAKQTGVEKKDFEVNVIVSNNIFHAEKKLPEFLQNQKTIALIKFINGELNNYPFFLSSQNKLDIAKIQQSGLFLNVIDKSSLNTANIYENVGIARDRAGAEVINRFIHNGAGGKGIIVLLDADSYLSENAVGAILKIFAENKINGLAGNMQVVVDKTLPHAELVEKVFMLATGYGEKIRKINSLINKSLLFQKKDNLQFKILAGGHNTVVLAQAWADAGGMPHYECLEMLRFGTKITNLPGDVANTTTYSAYTLLRISERVGFMSAGRQVLDISQRLEQYLAKKTSRLLIPRFGFIALFLHKITDCLETKPLDEKNLNGILQSCGFTKLKLSVKQLEHAAGVLNSEYAEASGPFGNNATFRGTNKLVMDLLWPNLPQEDYSSAITA